MPPPSSNISVQISAVTDVDRITSNLSISAASNSMSTSKMMHNESRFDESNARLIADSKLIQVGTQNTEKTLSKSNGVLKRFDQQEEVACEQDYMQENLPSMQLQPQLVPIQTFSFFKWEINVDTLVRLFIIA